MGEAGGAGEGLRVDGDGKSEGLVEDGMDQLARFPLSSQLAGQLAVLLAD